MFLVAGMSDEAVKGLIAGRIVCEDDAETDRECAAAPLTNNSHYLNAFLTCKQPFNNICHYSPLPSPLNKHLPLSDKKNNKLIFIFQVCQKNTCLRLLHIWFFFVFFLYKLSNLFFSFFKLLSKCFI